MKHPTAQVDVIDDVVVGVALVGPPAAGKTTILDLLTEMGATTVDVSECSRDPEEMPAEWKRVAMHAAKRTQASIPVCVVEGLESDQEVRWFDDLLERGVLVIRVDTYNENDRVERYVDRELNSRRDVVDEAQIREIQDEFFRREYEERPYPTHTVRLFNDNGTSPVAQTDRLEGLIGALSVP